MPRVALQSKYCPETDNVTECPLPRSYVPEATGSIFFELGPRLKSAQVFPTSSVGVLVGVLVAPAVVGDGVRVGVLVGEGPGVGVLLGVLVALGVLVLVGVGDGPGVLVRVGVLVGTGTTLTLSTTVQLPQPG